MRAKVIGWAACLVLAGGCNRGGGTSGQPGTSGGVQSPPAQRQTPRQRPARPGKLDRLAFNQAAVRLNLPLYWAKDTNGDGKPDPDEVVSLLFYPTKGPWVRDGRFTKAYREALAAIQQDIKAPRLPSDPSERQRRLLVRRDLDQGRPTLVFTDLTGLPGPEKEFVRHMLRAARLIDELYSRQRGISELRDRVPKDDPASQSLFRRNWGPDCKAPETEKNPKCTAIPGVHRPPVGVYPKAIQASPDFCDRLAKQPNADKLMAPFTVVVQKGKGFEPVPYSKAYADLMGQVAQELEAGAKALAGTNEKALVAYLKAAAQAFRTNNWQPADEAWAKMNVHNSAWYLRVGPDEVYWDPCARKAGFHLTLARINKKSLEWQEKLTPLRQDMENQLAKLIGPPYRARKVSFHLPDFIDIVINAGDDRKPFGATIGQSLPNWGPVANEGRGRTVTMTNLYTDPDSLAIQRKQAASLLCRASVAKLARRREPDVLGTIIHEAMHNLGPAHEYRVQGKKAPEIFGGPLASTLEELKAQTGALFFLPYLLEKKVISKEQMEQSYLRAFLWMLGHISRGMYSAGHKPKPYSHLSAIQLGFLLDERAIEFRPKDKAANGRDEGCFELHLDKLPDASRKLMALVGRIKGKGDRKTAEGLVAKYVDGKVVPQELIRRRMQRFPKASFVYGLKL